MVKAPATYGRSSMVIQLDQWMVDNHTNSDLRHTVIQYLIAQRADSIVTDLFMNIHDNLSHQETIGWKKFIEGKGASGVEHQTTSFL